MFIDLSRRFALSQTFIFTQIRIRYVSTVNRPTLAAASGPGLLPCVGPNRQTIGNHVNMLTNHF